MKTNFFQQFLFTTSFAITLLCSSCSNEENIPDQNSNNNEPAIGNIVETSEFLYESINENEDVEFPLFDVKTLKSVLSDLGTTQNNKALSYWGVGIDYRVWKWNGSSWGQPNPAARLRSVHLSSYGTNNGTGVWAIGTDSHPWKWNGSYWTPVFPSGNFQDLAPWDDTRALAIHRNSSGNEVLITIDGGHSWSQLGAKTGFISISVGSSYNVWGVWCSTPNNYSGTKYLYKYNFSTNNWDYVPTPVSPTIAAAMFDDGVYINEYTTPSRVFRASDGVTFIQPNPAARIYSSLDAANSDIICAIGWDTHPVYSTNSGGIWDYLNYQAHLRNVNAGYE
ncbi:MAG: hypothetical protein AB7V36_14310 [Bacteroidales bacterium]